MTGTQLTTAILVVLLASMMGAVVVLARGSRGARREARRYAAALLFVCAGFAIASWTRNGAFQDIYVDGDRSDTSATRWKVHQNRPLHFHDFVHYYLGPKYFRELGYLGLYDCLALADREVADEEHHPPRISGFVRDLEDILTDKPYVRSFATCKSDLRQKFSDGRWATFKADLRALAHLVPDNAWNAVVFDAGFNPPPSQIIVSSPITNLIPIEVGTRPTYLAATGIDLALLLVCFLAMRVAFGDITAAVFVTFFGASLVSDYSWNGGSVLRFSWFAAVVLGVVMLKKKRWAAAGAFLAFATCDRIFPVAFAAAAMVPIAMRARRSAEHRAILRRFGLGFFGVAGVLVVASLAVFGPGAWRMFFLRIGRHGDVYHVMHLGLKKVLTFRSWVPNQNFRLHEGNIRFRSWNLMLRETWAAMRPIALPLQAIVAAGTGWAASRRRPHEAAVLGGVVFMFVFNLPANYYYCILALVPALALRGAATAADPRRRWRDFTVFASFALFWTFSLLAPQLPGDDITFTFRTAVALFAFLIVWLVAWSELGPSSWRAWRERRAAAGHGPGRFTPNPGS